MKFDYTFGSDFTYLKTVKEIARSQPDKNVKVNLTSDAFFNGNALEFLVNLGNEPLKNIYVFIDSRDAKYKPNYFILRGLNVNYHKGEVEDTAVESFEKDCEALSTVFVRVKDDIILMDPYGYR